MKEFVAKTSNGNIFDLSYDSFNAPEYTLSHLVSGEKVDRESKIKIGYDKENLYFKFLCPFDAPFRKVVKSYNAKVYRGDCAEVFLAPFGDIKNYFEFDVSPFNGLCALKIENLDFYNIKVNMIEKNPIFTRTEILDVYYVVHYKIPLSIIITSEKVNNVDDIEWAFNCYRIDRHDKKQRISQALCPTKCKTHHDSRFFGKIKFQ